MAITPPHPQYPSNSVVSNSPSQKNLCNGIYFKYVIAFYAVKSFHIIGVTEPTTILKL